MSTWIDPQAKIVLTARIGNYCKVWAFAHVMDAVEIGNYCSIGGGAEIGRGAKIGEHTRVGFGVFIPNNTIIGNHVFIGPRVVMTDDKYPMVENPDYDARPPIVEDWASIGAGAVILPGMRIGSYSLIGAGAVVTHDVPSGVVVMGNPANIVSAGRKYVGRERAHS